MAGVRIEERGAVLRGCVIRGPLVVPPYNIVIEHCEFIGKKPTRIQRFLRPFRHLTEELSCIVRRKSSAAN